MEGFVLVSALGRGYVLCCFACCSRSRWKLAAAMHSRLAFIHLDGSLRPAMRQKGSEQALSLGNAQVFPTKVRQPGDLSLLFCVL